jgi:hypothetical protein
MLFRTSEARETPKAPPEEPTSVDCSYTSQIGRHTQKHGPGSGIPILMWLSDRFVLSAKKKGYVCPICDCFAEA